MSITNRLKHAWNAFTDPESRGVRSTFGGMSAENPVIHRRPSTFLHNDRSIVTTLITRIAVDIGMLDFLHATVDINGRYLGERVSGLNNCLTVEANIDQSALAFKMDIARTLLEDGVACVVPIETDFSPHMTAGFDIKNLRVGKAVSWHPQHVTVSVYNEKTGKRQNLKLHKKVVAIIYNPLYSIMNEPNSTLQRLIEKLKLMDSSDIASANNKLDLIIQLPYVVKSEQRRQNATQRLKDIEFQLGKSDLGIAYTDATESINQLNRPITNNLQERVEFLTGQLYSQLGITKDVLEGSASEEVMNNYYRRTVEPIAKAIAEELDRTFITKTARTQGQRVMYLRSQFDFVTTSNIGDLADKLIRNEVLTSNEIRGILGYRPSDSPGADELRNKNMPVKDTTPMGSKSPPEEVPLE